MKQETYLQANSPGAKYNEINTCKNDDVKCHSETKKLLINRENHSSVGQISVRNNFDQSSVENSKTLMETDEMSKNVIKESVINEQYTVQSGSVHVETKYNIKKIQEMSTNINNINVTSVQQSAFNRNTESYTSENSVSGQNSRTETDNNFSHQKNKKYLEKNKSKVARKREKRLEEDANAIEKFDHNIPVAGRTFTEDEIQQHDKKFHDIGLYNNKGTFAGLEVKTGLPWGTIRDHVKSFDMIGFHGGDGVSSFIGWWQAKMASHVGGDKITHTGVIIRGEDFPEDHVMYRPGQIYCWESTMSGPLAFDKVKNVDGSKCHFYKLCSYCKCPVPSVPHRFGFLGTQFRDMGQLTIRYDANPSAKLIWCRLNEENRKKVDDFLAGDGTLTKGERLLQMMDEWNGRSYNSTCCCIDLYAAMFPCCRWLQNAYAWCCPIRVGNNGAQFCSEFVANLYKEMGILHQDLIAKRVVPADYMTIYDNDEDKNIISLDQDKNGVPILFRSYVQFTARSKLGKQINLKKEYLDNLKPEPEPINEKDINSTSVYQETNNINYNVPVAGISVPGTSLPSPLSDSELPYPNRINVGMPTAGTSQVVISQPTKTLFDSRADNMPMAGQ